MSPVARGCSRSYGSYGLPLPRISREVPPSDVPLAKQVIFITHDLPAETLWVLASKSTTSGSSSSIPTRPSSQHPGAKRNRVSETKNECSVVKVSWVLLIEYQQQGYSDSTRTFIVESSPDKF